MISFRDWPVEEPDPFEYLVGDYTCYAGNGDELICEYPITRVLTEEEELALMKKLAVDQEAYLISLEWGIDIDIIFDGYEELEGVLCAVLVVKPEQGNTVIVSEENKISEGVSIVLDSEEEEIDPLYFVVDKPFISVDDDGNTIKAVYEISRSNLDQTYLDSLEEHAWGVVKDEMDKRFWGDDVTMTIPRIEYVEDAYYACVCFEQKAD